MLRASTYKWLSLGAHSLDISVKSGYKTWSHIFTQHSISLVSPFFRARSLSIKSFASTLLFCPKIHPSFRASIFARFLFNPFAKRHCFKLRSFGHCVAHSSVAERVIHQDDKYTRRSGFCKEYGKTCVLVVWPFINTIGRLFCKSTQQMVYFGLHTYNKRAI